jgi:hypothetical protein
MSKHRRKAEPVTRREVMRIVQSARDEIISAVVHGNDHRGLRPGTRATDGLDFYALTNEQLGGDS